jgi:hypothetical protein
LLLNILPYQNSDEKFMIYSFKISYIVCYELTKFELKTSLVNGEIKKYKIVLKGKLN